MGKIYILPDRISNRIAAGEVVERPSSVVKELIENSLDAGSTEIRIKIIADGRKLIEVTDNGCGMDYDDAIISLERHSTSKIKNAEDLDSIDTLGFRGEALASIASVSRLTLTTKSEDESAATKAEVSGGRMINVSRIPRESGTTVRVEDLFYNTPARRKFLKSGSVEMRWIIRIVNRYAIVNPGIRFEMHSQNRVIVKAVPAQTIFERIYQLYGENIAKLLLPFDQSADNTRVFGYCSHTNHSRSTNDHLNFFINKRAVNDRIITHAVREAYKHLLPSGKYPTIFLFIEMPCEAVDVNVHPTKTEIRFSSPDAVHGLIEKSIRGALLKSSPVLSFELTKKSPSTPEKIQTDFDSPFEKKISNFLSDGKPLEHSAITKILPVREPAGAQESLRDTSRDIPSKSPVQPETKSSFSPSSSSVFPEAFSSLPDLSELPFSILGQYNNSFILAEIGEDLYIVDQHVAHERIRYEELKDLHSRGKIESQSLLMPETIELSLEEAVTMEELQNDLFEVGFEVEPFGDKTWVIKTTPLGLVGPPKEILNEIISNVSELKHGRESGELRLTIIEETITSLSCHGAIKKNMPLTIEKMNWLMEELLKCREPYRCPHGRPVIIKLSRREIFSKFGRGKDKNH